MTFDNQDGSSRQDEIARCDVGDRIELYRERHNPFDPSAVAVFTERDVQVGYVGADRCAWIGSKIDRGYSIHCAVEQITGGLGGGWLGMTIRLWIAGGELAPPTWARAA